MARPSARVVLLMIALACWCCTSCDSKPSADKPTTQSTIHSPSVASLVPAATDLIIGMGAADHLVAVSNFDSAAMNLPRVGDYQNTDWEKLAELRPVVMIVQMDENRIPAGLRDRATANGATLVNIQIERLDDIFRAIHQLGDVLHEPAKAAAAEASLRARLDAVRLRVSNATPVRTFVALDDTASFSAGPGTFLDDLLTIAGGTNVLAGTNQHWPSVDKERLFALAPDAVIELFPGASRQVLKHADDFWASIPNVPAVAAGRIYQINHPWAITPGCHVADVAEELAADLHPMASTRPATQAAP